MNSASYTPRPAPREGDQEGAGTAPLLAVAVAQGVDHFPGFLDRAAQATLRDEVMAILDEAPPFRPRMPRTGKPFSVLMSNCGALGWVSDEAGYRYQADPPGDRPALAGDAAEPPRRLGENRPGRAAAGGLPHQPL